VFLTINGENILTPRRFKISTEYFLEIAFSDRRFISTSVIKRLV